MRYIFLGVFMTLVAASAATYLSEPEVKSDKPVLYWMTDPNPARKRQVDLFYAWMKRNGHVDEKGEPVFRLELDTVNQRKIGIQAISGVAGDLMDIQVPYAQPSGYLHDVTDKAKELGFDLARTYEGVEPMLAMDGRQYGFPCNASVNVYWVNKDAFAKVGMEPPPRYWDFDTFERIGKEFVRRSNQPGKRQTVFFANGMIDWFGDALIVTMIRSTGLDALNETNTACILDDPRYARVLARTVKWVKEDHLFPSAADEATLSGGVDYQGMANTGGLNGLLNNGQIAMLNTGRWVMVRVRGFDKQANFSVSALPGEEFPNGLMQARPAVIYSLSPFKDTFAPLFLAFLASREYNEDIVATADALPPCPEYTHIEEFVHPKGHENEWDGHVAEAEIAEKHGIGIALPPYAAVGQFQTYRKDAFDKVLLNMATPQDAAREAERRINDLFAERLRQSPSLMEQYRAACEDQKTIDRLRSEGKKVPLDLIRNPFHRRYYVHKGWAEVSE